MPRFALLLEYDGAPFAGWQRQAAEPTVQAALEDALRRLEPDAPAVAAAGRTDTGVHAAGQVAHCDLARDWDPVRLVEALNHHLRPAPVAVLRAAAAPAGFHARFSARARHYTYRILCRRAPPVLARGQVWHRRQRLAVAPMQAAALDLLGTHDFTTFRAALCQAASPVKTLDRLEIEEHPAAGGVEVRFHLSARSFLHNQVRSIVGTLERVGAGAWDPGQVRAALAARDRAACGPVAPAAGLCLMRVDYDPDPFS
jgi:tRNA pseudouridine38-40 synthase